MNPASSDEYHKRLAYALDRSAEAQQSYNKWEGKSYCLQYWAAPLNNGRHGSYNLPPGVIQLIHCMTTPCNDAGNKTEVECFCIKEVLTPEKTYKIQFFVTNHTKGECPHRTYKEPSSDKYYEKGDSL